MIERQVPNRVGGSGCEQPEYASRTTVRTVPVYGGSLAKSQFLDYVLSRARLEWDMEATMGPQFILTQFRTG